ncbi:uncharacterized protein LOC115540923 isoform X2 [Gadus morhua]|uniref:uncharacterized protein LOC115540923 isoform X2 n=1 Tax=Gadus morhua TaxID=8049 RepID=UPI0011B57205|nr:uncharacterized protein LOC115540923 isoform X2 [Gadus morhua]
MIFFALSVFTLGLVTAEPNGSMNTTWATTDTSDVTQGTKATADNTTNDTTFRMSEREQTTGGGAINAPSAQSANPNPNETPKPNTTPNPETTSSTTSAPILKEATTTIAKHTKDVVQKTTTAGSHESGVDAIGITIICVVLLICLLIAVGCFVKRNYQSRYSVDLRTEAASVPLSVVVDHTEPGDSTVYTGMQTSDNGQVDSKKSQDSQNNEVPKPKDSGPAEDPKPKESGVAEDPQPKDSGVTEVPQPMTEQKDQAEQARLVEAGATGQPASPGPAEAGALEGATDDEGISSAESLKEPTEGAGSSAQTEASATDALIEN